MPLLRRFLSRIGEDILLLVLLVALVPLLWLMSEQLSSLHRLVDWKTMGALTGLLVLSRGLEDSGYLARAGSSLLARIHGERTLAAMLVLFSAALAAVVTNDVALFIVVPLTLSLRTVAALPVGRLVIFEALAVNAGSTLSPVGNPQNLFLWQSSPLGFLDFTWMMLPLGIGLILLVLAAVPIGFPAATIRLSETRQPHAGLDRSPGTGRRGQAVRRRNRVCPRAWRSTSGSPASPCRQRLSTRCSAARRRATSSRHCRAG